MNQDFRFEAGKTLIFFDEIQEFPEITTSLKFFKEDGRFDVICSGSLLGIQHKRIESHSVGYKTDVFMRSFDFEEFLWAVGYPENIADEILDRMDSLKPFLPVEMKLYSSLYMDYILLGGMPAVLHDYFTRHTFERTLIIQRQILLDYKEDIQKYAESLDKTKILAVFNQIAPQLSKENKKFQYSKISSGARSREYFGCVEWLLDAGVASICHCLNFPELPLKGNIDEQKFKLYIPDTGLLVAMLDDEAGADLRINNNLGVYKGAIYENIVAEAFSKSGYDLYYYRREDGSLEENFFVRTASELIPVEVKSGNAVSKSLRNLISSKHYPDIHHGIKFINGNISQTETITTFPYFCAFLLRRYLKNKMSL
ncbi:MAG: ATP-binding protein [Victivallales bacterium]|nr:ATP-binding protein [Victivallales bacterium]